MAVLNALDSDFLLFREIYHKAIEITTMLSIPRSVPSAIGTTGIEREEDCVVLVGLIDDVDDTEGISLDEVDDSEELV